MYKILAMVLEIGWRTLLVNVISKTKTTFVKESRILYGTFITNEIVDEAIKLKKKIFVRLALKKPLILCSVSI